VAAAWFAIVGAAVAPTSAYASYRHAVLHYGADPLQTVSVFPASQPGSPLVVLVHGGGFRSTAGMANGLATNASQLNSGGAAVFIVNYRSTTAGYHVADQVADVVAGTRWAIAHAATYDADPGDVNLVGGSSGGLLAADAAFSLDTAPGAVHAVVTLSAPTDLTSALAYWLTVPGHAAKIHQRNITTAVGCASATTCAASATGPPSPVNLVTSSNCPQHFLVVNGTAELQPTAQADELAAALRLHGCPSTEDLLATASHGFDYWSQVEPTIAALLP
jgi:acetyl esterase/lipase